MRATIKDVAKKSGVSIATVSNVISQKKYVSPILAQKVNDVMKELDYTPNYLAIGLKKSKSFRIGVIVPDVVNPFFGEFIEVIERELDKTEYHMVLFNTNYNAKKEEKIIRAFVENKQLDGLISVDPSFLISDKSIKIEIPIVIVDHRPYSNPFNISFVYTDNILSSRMIAQEAYDLGYRHFAYISGQEMINTSNIRLNGFKSRLIELGIPNENIVVKYSKLNFESGNQSMKEILNSPFSKNRIAVFCPSDISAWGALEAIKEYKYKIPEEIGIVGFDNVYFTEYLNPKLTTFNNPCREMGLEASKQILRKLKSNTPSESTIPGHFIKRESL